MVDTSLVEHLTIAAERWPERPAWTFDLDDNPAATLTFADVASRSASYAQALHERGVGPGDRVAVMLDNHPASHSFGSR